MLKRLTWCALLMVMLASSSTGGQKSGVDRFGWMSGCWVSDDGRQRIEECWMKPAGQTLIGTSRTVAGGKTVFTEYAEIRETKDGTAYTVSLGLGARPVSFQLVRATVDEAVFENPAHDFPQRIVYKRDSADSLFARIEGREKGISKAIDFRYKRSRCE
jgi:uncharacterized protein DUF6265